MSHTCRILQAVDLKIVDDCPSWWEEHLKIEQDSRSHKSRGKWQAITVRSSTCISICGRICCFCGDADWSMWRLQLFNRQPRFACPHLCIPWPSWAGTSTRSPFVSESPSHNQFLRHHYNINIHSIGTLSAADELSEDTRDSKSSIFCTKQFQRVKEKQQVQDHI